MAGALAGQEAAVQVVQGGHPGRGGGDLSDLAAVGGGDRVGGLHGPDLDDIADPDGGQDGLCRDECVSTVVTAWGSEAWSGPAFAGVGRPGSVSA